MTTRALLQPSVPRKAVLMRARQLLVLCLLSAAVVAQPSQAAAPTSYGVAEQVNVPFRMADGTTLVGSIYRPTGAPRGARFPVLVAMTPYGTWDGNSAFPANYPGGGSDNQELRYFAQHGYVGLEVDSRGSGRSAGHFAFLDPQQGRDYLQVIDIAAHHLTGSNGLVGLTGMSYRGLNQLLVGGLLRPGTPVKAIAPASAGATVYDDPFVQGGIASEFWHAYPGILGISAVPPADQDAAPGGADPRLATVAVDRAGSAPTLASMPADMLRGGESAYRDSWWQAREPISSAPALVRAGVPVLLTTGPTDYFARGALRMYAALQSVAHGDAPYNPMSPQWRPDRRFQLVYSQGYTDGDVTYWLPYALQWYDHWLKGKANGVAGSDTTLHLETTSGWIGAHTYPFTRHDTKLYLVPGALTAQQPREEPLPELPWVPNATQSRAATPGASQVFTSRPFTRGATLAGPVTVTLAMRSTSPQVEIIATLNDVAPDGTVTTAVPGFEVDSDLIGSLRAIDPRRSWYDDSGAVISPWHPYTRASERPVPVGAVETYQLELHPRLWSVRPGHRLQVVLTTQSDRLVLNAPQLAGLVGGRYTVLTGRSWVNLPILPADAFRPTVDPHTVGLR